MDRFLSQMSTEKCRAANRKHCFQYSCQNNAACNFFTFDKVSKWCYLKDSAGCNATSVNRISGPKNCGYMQGHFLANRSLEIDTKTYDMLATYI
jgi:hypothetical protein